jgi:hypothetical protein
MRKQRNQIVFSLLVSLFLLGVFFAAVTPTHGQIGLHGQALSQPGLPVELKSVSVDSSIVAKETWLHYTLTNTGSEPLDTVTVLVLAFDARRNPLGGQAMHEKVSLFPGQSERRKLRLSNRLYAEPMREYRRFVIAVEGGASGNNWWTQPLPFSQLVRLMRDGSRAPSSSPVVSPIAAQELEPVCGDADAWCDRCAARATGSCGAGNVASVDCRAGSGECTCSWTCR